MLETEPKIIQDYVRSGKLRFVYRHLAQIGDLSVTTGEASECASDQGAFWQMRNQLYAHQSDVYGGDPRKVLAGLAGELGLEVAAFNSCLDSGKHRQFVLDDYAAAQKEGVRQRPEFRLGGERLVGALPYTDFQQKIDAVLTKS